MLTKMNTRMSEETINDLKSTKAAVQVYGHTSKVPITFEMVKAVQNSYKLYSQHIREQQQRKKANEAEAHKRTLDDMNQEEKRLHEKSEQLTSEHTAVEEAMQRVKGYVEEGGAKIRNALANKI